MPILNVEGYGRVQFPDSMSEQDIAAAIEKQGASGSTIAEHLAADRTFKPTEEQFKRYEEHLKSDDTDTPWTQLLIDGAGHMLSTAGSAVAGVVTAPHKAPGSIVEGAAQGTQSLYQMAAQSEDPDSVAFKLKDTLFNSGTLHERWQQFLQAREFNTNVEKNTAGDETLIMPRDMVDNRIVQGAALVLDPTLLIPVGGEVVGAGKLATKLTAKATVGVGRAARRLAAPVNAALRLAGEGVARATGLTAHEMQIAAGAAGAGALANPVGQAVVGTAVAARGLDIFGDAMTRVGKAVTEQPTRLNPFEQVAMDATAPKSVRAFANAAHRLGGDVALDLTPRVAMGAAQGSAIGGALGYYNNGEEGAAAGIGGGLVLGGVGAGVARSIEHMTGRVQAEQLKADFARRSSTFKDVTQLRTDGASEGVQSMFDSYGARLDETAHNGSALLLDAMDRMAGIGGEIKLVSDNTLMPKDGLQSTKYQGVSVGKVNGKDTVYINVRRATSSTAGHEFLHALLNEGSKNEMVGMGRQLLFGHVAPDGVALTEPLFPRATIESFVKSYADATRPTSPSRANDWLEHARVAFDESAPVETRILAQNRIADEFLATYGGYSMFKESMFSKKPTYNNALQVGAIPTLLESFSALIRDTWQRRTEAQLRANGIEFGKLSDAFKTGNGKLIRSRTLDSFLKDALRRDFTESDGEARAKVNLKTASEDALKKIHEAYGDAAPIRLDPNGKLRLTSPDEALQTSQNRFDKLKRELDALPPERRGVTIDVDENGLQSIDVTNITPEERAVMHKHMTPDLAERMATMQNSIASKDGQLVFNMTYLTPVGGRNTKKSYTGVVVRNRDHLPYRVLLSRDGDFYTRSIDMNIVRENVGRAFKHAEKGLFNSVEDFWSQMQSYLKNLTTGDKTSREFFGGGSLGEKKRNAFYEALGTMPAPTKGAVVPVERLPRIGYAANAKDKPFKSFRLDRIRTHSPTGEVLNFQEHSTYGKSQVNYMPGYREDFSKSNNAHAAEGNGRFPASEIARQLKVPVAFIKQHAPHNGEWHHSSKYYNVVQYYDLATVRDWLAGDGDYVPSGKEPTGGDMLAEWRMQQKALAQSGASVARGMSIKYLEWSGSRSHPHATEVVEHGVHIEQKPGQKMVTITRPDGTKFKKGLETKGFEIQGADGKFFHADYNFKKAVEAQKIEALESGTAGGTSRLDGQLNDANQSSSLTNSQHDSAVVESAPRMVNYQPEGTTRRSMSEENARYSPHDGNEKTREVAESYKRKFGIDAAPFKYVEPSVAEFKRLADYYDTVQHDPHNPAVVASYQSLLKQVLDQYQHILDAGIKHEVWTGDGEPYASSKDMLADVRDNNHLYSLPTTSEHFGSNDVAETSGNPMLADSGLKAGDRALTLNDVFRFVHDYFGHTQHGLQFGAVGEYNAFLEHASTLTRDAVPALANETLLQNTWFNYGRHLRNEAGDVPKKGEKGYLAPQQRPFADRRINITPEEILPRYQPAEKSPTDPTRFTVERIGDTEVHTHETGARVLLKGNVHRVYDAGGALLGVTSSDAKAEKLLSKHLEKQNTVELTKDGGVVTGADSFALTKDIAARFQPASKDIHLEDYADRKVFALTTDRMGIGDAFIGVNGAKKKLSVPTQGGVGFMNIFNGGGWAFAQEATASSFLRRVREVAGGQDSALVALTILTPENHMKNQTGQLAYVEALHAAVDTGAVSKKLADRHIRELVRRVKTSKDATMVAETTLKQKLRGITGLDSYEAAVRAGTFNFTDEKYLADKKAGRTLPIPHAEAKRLGIAFEDIARDIGDKAFMDEPTGTVVALLEIDANQKPLNDDFHHSYPWSIHGKRIGYLKKFHELKHLTSDKRVIDKRGNINMQPVMLTMPVLDRIREGTQPRYQPFSEATTETLGDTTVQTDRSGMKMTQRGSGAARLYAADGRLIGVYSGVAEAVRRASRSAVIQKRLTTSVER